MVLVISRTPVRVSFFGGGTDYRDFYLRGKGAVLGTTIDKYTYVTVKKGASFFPHSIRISYSKTECINHLEEIEHPSIRESLRFTKLFLPLDIHIFSDLPARTGLGSSSSFTVGFLHALYALEGKKVCKQQLAEEACHIEQKMIQEKVGSQDQYHAAFGGFNLMEFFSDYTSVKPIFLSEEKKAFLQNHLMLFYTGMTRHADIIIQEQVEKTRTKKNDFYLSQMLQLVYEAEEILQKEEGDPLIQKLGALLDFSWNLKKKLSSRVTNKTINGAYEKAKQRGALGGKLCGAGEGGFLLLVVPAENREAIQQALHPFFPINISFEKEGSSIIYKKD